jgi:hypothetical protein
MRKRNALVCGAALVVFAALTVWLAPTTANGVVLKGAAAFGDWHKDKPGVRRQLTPEDLPPPFATPSATNRPDVIPRHGGSKPSVHPASSSRW